MGGPNAFDAAIPLNPAVALYGEALALWRAGETKAAADRLDGALRLRPDFAEAFAFGAYILERKGQPDSAARFYRRALELKPDMPVAWANLGKLLFAARRFEEALEAFDRGLASQPENADLHNSRAGALREIGRLGDAERAARRSLALREDLPEAALNLGNALIKLGRSEEALGAYTRAEAMRAGYADAFCGQALALRALGRIDEARGRFEAAAKLDCREAISGLGCLDLMTGDFERGWEGYEARWLSGRSLSEALGVRFPFWQGPGRRGERVIVFNDHGLVDTIQFSRYLALMDEAGVETTYVVPARVHRLLASASRARLVERMPEDETFDAQIAVSSLPRAFRTRLDTIPATTPYLIAESERRACWAERIGARGFKIGLVWQGSPDPGADAARSFPLRALAPLAAVDGVRLISLQKGFGSEQLLGLGRELIVESLGADFDGGADAFVDTAAAMAHLDLVVSCDTSSAHLAGALGRPVWLALKFDAEWRWLRGRDDSPWYPSARLFRQTNASDWTGVFENMAAALAERVQAPMP